jgi:CubicO group peptidase (beta-lactamase class C family)
MRAGAVALLATLLGAAPVVARQAAFPPDPRIDTIFARWDRPGSPGCAVGILQNGRVTYARGYGYANLDYDIPITPSTVFYSGSVSKQFTAAAVVLLAAEGRIGLDDDVRRYIPELPDYGQPLTIRHLIHHTSGLRDIYVLMDLAGHRLQDVFTDEDALALIARQKELNFTPGAEHLYSNSGYFLLSQMVKRVTGTSLREYADRAIFRPLGMTNTHFHDETDHIIRGRAVSYQPDGHGGFRISYLTNFDKIGAGGLYTTIEDLAKWDANFDEPKVGGPGFLQQMHTRGVLHGGDTLAYAFGLTIGDLRGLPSVRHSGSMMGFQAHFLRLPGQHFSAAALCNLGDINPGSLLDRVAEVHFGDRMRPRTSPAAGGGGGGGRSGADAAGSVVDPAVARALVGEYRSEELDVTYRIEQRAAALLLVRPLSSTPLRAAGAGTFRAGNLELRVLRGGDGAVIGFTVAAGRVRNIAFRRSG